MTMRSGQVASTGTAPVLSASTVAALVEVPPGPCTVVISNTSNVTVYVAPVVLGGSAPTAAAIAVNGFSIPSDAPPVEINSYPGSAGVQFYVLAASTPTGAVSYLISTTG